MNALRNEIQHLRGISILAVLSFHLFPNFFKNGYLGVDIFFVISGYLITNQLLAMDSVSLGEYLKTFYFRRMKRIIPSAISVLIVTLVAAYFILGIVTFVQNLDGAKWANTFGANWYFLIENLDYFATGNLHLFQHYWSLAIEEQFYLLWPLILFKSGRNRLIPSALFLTSLALFSISGYPANFYNTFNRIWELLAGALLAIWRPAIEKKVTPWVSILLLALVLLPISSPQRASTFIVVIATALFIAAARPTTIKGPLFYLGQISFTLYLVHYPVIRIYDELNPSAAGISRLFTSILIIATVSLAIYIFIERPIRYRSYKNPVALIALLGAFLFIIQGIFFALKGYYV